ncbi:MAG: N-(5'-phosphoribosyl)anthranilate isomerase [Flammeovirgaceae bacterium]|nr:N-(5'-phosphoribosyl)anthranilate isomerase [Flammeovirgaceae bacterium]
MALKTRVKVSEVKNLHDGRYCAGMGVEMIGLPIDPKLPGYIKPETFAEISGWLSGISYVGELKTLEELNPDDYALDFIETKEPGLINELILSGIPIILRIDLDNFVKKDELTSFLTQYAGITSFFLMESSEKMDEDKKILLKELAAKYDLFIGFGINKENVNEIIDTIKPLGIGLKGAEEIKTGLNNFDELADILEAIDTDEYL